MKHDRFAMPLPDWPAVMDEALARAYVSLGADVFQRLVRRHKVLPVDCDGARVLRYRRRDLDRMVDSLPARGETAPDEAAAPPLDSSGDDADAGLDRVRRRAAEGRGRRRK